MSESLGDFALYGVASIVKKYEGRLIYAGGDDVCAVLPIGNALKAAKEIQKYYGSAFRIIKKSGETADDSQIISEPIKDKDNQKWKTEPGKLSVNLGSGACITISAGILLCHHKENLSEMIKRVHSLLDKKAKAKEEGGRNAVAIELRKRSGGSRYFVSKWDDERLTKFEDLVDQKKVGEDLSSSLAYRFEEFKGGIGAILKKTDKESLLADFVMSQLKRSGNNKTIDEPDMLSKAISRIIIDNNGLFSNEGLIIAGFLANPDKKQ
jgi:CRISPR-associated protein Cmr2